MTQKHDWNGLMVAYALDGGIKLYWCGKMDNTESMNRGYGLTGITFIPLTDNTGVVGDIVVNNWEELHHRFVYDIASSGGSSPKSLWRQEGLSELRKNVFNNSPNDGMRHITCKDVLVFLIWPQTKKIYRGWYNDNKLHLQQ